MEIRETRASEGNVKKQVDPFLELEFHVAENISNC
jgi:hypothetical protein